MVGSRFGPIIVLAAIGAFVGYLIGVRAEQVTAGVVFGIFVAIPLGAVIVNHRRRWVAVALLNLVFAAAYFVGDIRTLGFSVIAGILAFSVSAVSLRELYNGNSLDAISHHFKIVTGLANGYQVIEGGRITVPEVAGKVFGPRMVIIKSENVVVFARGASKTIVLGPDIYTTGAYECADRVFDLRHARRHLAYGEVLTSDVMTVNIGLNAVFGIDLQDDLRLGHRKPNPVTKKKLTAAEEALLQNLDLNVPDWEDALLTVIESYLRQAVAIETLDNLMKPAVYHRLESRILRAANSRVSPWGMIIDEIVVVSVQPSLEVIEAQVEVWQADAQAAQTAIREKAQAAAKRDALRLMADGYDTAKAMGMSTEVIDRQFILSNYEQEDQEIISSIIEALDQNQLEMTQEILRVVQTTGISEKETSEILDKIQSLLEVLQTESRAISGQAEIARILSDATLDAKHKLKLSLPLIPKLLSYETELNLGSELNLRELISRILN